MNTVPDSLSASTTSHFVCEGLAKFLDFGYFVSFGKKVI